MGDDDNHNDNEKPSSDYEVGYGKPPVATRFQLGRSGNPEGGRKRKKQDVSVSALIKDCLFGKTPVSIGVRQKRMTRAEAFIRGTTSNVLKGKAGARKMVDGWMRDLAASGEATAPQAATSDADLAILQGFLDRNQGKTLKPARQPSAIASPNPTTGAKNDS